MHRLVPTFSSPRTQYAIVVAVWCGFLSLPLLLLAAVMRGFRGVLEILLIMPVSLAHDRLKGVRWDTGAGWFSLSCCLLLLGIVLGGFALAGRWWMRWLGYAAWTIYLGWSLFDFFTNWG